MFVGKDSHPHAPNDGAEMMTAGTAHGYWLDDHQFVEVFRIGELCNTRRRNVAAAENLVQVHLGHPAGGIAGVMVVSGVDDEAFQNALHLACELVKQSFHITLFDECRDIVIGIIALVRLLDPRPDARRSLKCLAVRRVGR